MLDPQDSVRRVRFGAGDRALQEELRARVDAYFVAAGTKKTANAAMVAKTAFWLLAAVTLFAVVSSGVLPALAAWPLAALLGVVMAAVGFNVGHDAIHGAWSEKPWVNRLLAHSFDVLGASATTWAEAHNFVHHTYTNVPGVDHDLEPGPFMTFHPEKSPSKIHRYQHIYSFFLYLMTFVVWVFKKDFQQVLSVDPRTGRRHDVRAVVGVFGWKLVHFGLFLGVPLWSSGYAPWQVVVGYASLIAAAGFTLAVVFQLAHVVEDTVFPVPGPDGRLSRSWTAHQLATTANFAPESPFWNFFTGGLNHQIEHHLFYKICHIHYPALAPIVADVARRHGVPYVAYPTFRAALASHVRTMRRLGRPQPRLLPPPSSSRSSSSVTARAA
jgi:linoleoyl-CoA desaturase